MDQLLLLVYLNGIWILDHLVQNLNGQTYNVISLAFQIPEK